MPCKIQVRGEGPKNAKLMLIGEAPGRQEVEQKRPFVGRAGRFLNKTLSEVKIARTACYITNVVKFRSTQIVSGKTTDRAPTPDEISACLPILKREIARVKPRVVVLLGRTAGFALLGAKKIEHGALKRDKIVFIPTYHPAVAIRNRKFRKIFVEDLRTAAKIVGGHRAAPIMIQGGASLLRYRRTAGVRLVQPPRSDWHVHTTYSDGRSSPSEVVARAKRAGLREIAICDHDCTDGVAEAMRAGRRLGVGVVPGIEITVNDTFGGREMSIHVLGLGVDTKNAALRAACRRLARYREEYTRKCILRLHKLGFDIRFFDVRKLTKGTLGVAHICNALMRKQSNVKRLEKYLGREIRDRWDMLQPIADILLRGMNVRETIAIVKRAGGMVVLAHPGFGDAITPVALVPDAKIRRYAKFGMDGIESNSRHHNGRQNKHYAALAKKLGIITMRGSDSHD